MYRKSYRKSGRRSRRSAKRGFLGRGRRKRSFRYRTSRGGIRL